jgi:hypothetical protein
MKYAIVVLSDPKNGAEESAGRAFNALSADYDFKHQGDDVTVLFQGPAPAGSVSSPRRSTPFTCCSNP